MAGVERGVLPMGDWSMTTRRLKCSVPCTRRGISFFPERACLTAGMRQSRTRVDFPEPEGPEMQVNVPTGIFRVTLLRLCLSAPVRTRRSAGAVLRPEAGMLRLPESHSPVGLPAFSSISAREPCARIRPPLVPAPGPMSTR